MTNGTPQQKKSGCGKALAIGCLVVICLAVIGGFLAYRGVKSLASRLTEKYTATVPSPLPALQVSDQEAAEVLARYEAFTNAVKAGLPTTPLQLTSRDINVLIHTHPSWTNMAGKVYIAMEGDAINGQASIPLEALGGMLAGRWLNGSVTFRVEMSAGRLLVFLDALTVKGEPLPEDFMRAFRAKNLAEKSNEDPATVQVLQRLESITVRDGTLRVVPKQIL